MHTGSAPCKQTKEMGLKQILPSLLSEGTNPVDTLTLDFQSPESGDNILLLFKSLDLWYFFFYSNPTKLIHTPQPGLQSQLCTGPQGSLWRKHPASKKPTVGYDCKRPLTSNLPVSEGTSSLNNIPGRWTPSLRLTFPRKGDSPFGTHISTTTLTTAFLWGTPFCYLTPLTSW